MNTCSKELEQSFNTISTPAAGPKSLAFWAGNVPLDEPYRRILAPLRNRLKITCDYLTSVIGVAARNLPVQPDGYLLSVNELIDPLMLCFESLEKCGDKVIADGRLKDLIRRLYAFGLSLFKLGRIYNHLFIQINM